MINYLQDKDLRRTLKKISIFGEPHSSTFLLYIQSSIEHSPNSPPNL